MRSENLILRTIMISTRIVIGFWTAEPVKDIIFQTKVSFKFLQDIFAI